MSFGWRCLLILWLVFQWTDSKNTDCGKGQFPCDTGEQCVKRTKWCDKHPDCYDQSDEAYCTKATFWGGDDPNKCDDKRETHIKCGSGICLPIFAKCDGHPDCDDGADERQCEVTAPSHDAIEASGSNEINIDDDEKEFIVDVDKDDESEDSKESSSESKEDSKESSESTEDSKESSEELLFPKPSAVPSAPKSSQVPIFPVESTSQASVFDSTKSTLPIPSRSSVAFSATSCYINTTCYPYHKTLGKRPPMFVNIIPSPSREASAPLLLHRHRHHHELRSRLRNYNNGPYATEYKLWDTNQRPYKKHKDANKPFYFAKDYASLYGKENSRSLESGMNWILRQRNNDSDWGKDTARALITLALTKNEFPLGNGEYESMKRRFMVQLGADLLQEETFILRTHTGEFNINKLARMINALLAVCENPRDLHGVDLIDVLRAKIRDNFNRRQYYVNPYVYLTLCLSNSSLSTQEFHNLIKQMTLKNHATEMARDMQSLAIQAFMCHMHQATVEGDPAYRMSLHETLYGAVSHLQQRMYDDGSFGSIYSTALAAQALISVNASIQWEPRKTFHYLKGLQQKDGSFGDFLATYYVLPVLSGRSLLHLRNIRCDLSDIPHDMMPSEMLEFVGPKQYIHYSIYFGSSLVSSHSLKVLVPQGISLLDMMRVAEYQDENFRFSLEEDTFNVYSLSGIPNDAEQDLFWHLYIKQESDKGAYTLNAREQYNGDLRKFFPRQDQHVIFWYHPKMERSFN